MTEAEQTLLLRLAHGERLDWVHPFTAVGVALDGGGGRRALQQRTVHTCLSKGWITAQSSRAYFQPIVITDAGMAALEKRGV